ncbi:MAG: hypothetical protein RIT43_2211 [Bacteroidota bacterium]|jgi:predicted esterase
MAQKFQFKKTYRYETYGDQNASVLLYVLHGYGQLAPFFIRKFIPLENAYIVAPEGMHRFYLNGTSGRVGASWMTKEEREDDISDNIQWLNALNKEICSRGSYQKIIVLGFSQGGATAARWFNSTEMHADHLVMWSSVFPPDISKEKFVKPGDTRNFFVIGTNDAYFSGDAYDEAITFYSCLNFEVITYSGDHNIHTETLHSILSEFQ